MPSTPRTRPSGPRSLLRAAAGLLAAAALVLAVPLSASAHVTVSSTSAVAGGYARLTFSVPTESETERTVRVEVELPEATPFTSVRTVRVPGWTAELIRTTLSEPVAGAHGTEITEAVTRVVWSADTPEDGITPDETGLFVLSVGPLPDVERVFFPALQVYDSGREVYWSQQADGDAEPDHPAPSLALTSAAGADADAHGTADADTDAEAHADAEAATPAAADGQAALPWAVTAAIGSLAALLVAIAAWARARRQTPSSPA